MGILWVLNAVLRAASTPYCPGAHAETSLPIVLSFLDSHAQEAEQELVELAAIPSISSIQEYHAYVVSFLQHLL